jgi:AcrR family transcriptional regulator
MTFKVTVVNKFSENVLHKGRNGAGVKAELFFIRFDKTFGKHHVSDTKRGRDRFGKGMKKEYRCTLRTKKMIRAAFVELVGEKKNMENITVSELASRANIAKSAFYNHYDDVYAVAEEFENELIAKLSSVLDEIELERSIEYENYFRKVIEFLKVNEDIYRKAITSPDVRFFIEKLKAIISKKIFEDSAVLPFSQNKAEKYAQIRFLTNACVDTMVDYFKGNIDLSLDEVGEVIMDFLHNMRK